MVVRVPGWSFVFFFVLDCRTEPA